MEAILLVGGLGTRMRPLTDNLPKPLLPVAGVPLIEHQIVRAREAGVDHVVLATSFRAAAFTDVVGDGARLGVRVSYAEEDEPLGTGGAIRNAAAKLESAPGDPVLVFNGDIIDGHDIAGQVAWHVSEGADVTLYLTRVDDPRAYGCVPTDEAGRVTAFHEKMPQPVTDQINAGCYVFGRSVIDEIPAGRVVSVERETFPEMLNAGRTLLGHVESVYWRDLGTPDAYVRGSADVVRGLVDAPARPGPAGEFLVSPDADVSPRAVLLGGTSVAPAAIVHEDAEVDGAVVLGGAVIGVGAVVRNSAIGRGAQIGDSAVLDRVVVGDDVKVGAGAIPEVGARLT
ncbi:MAG TPA: NDP-sugar synthase [Jiangellaceae bacterium]